MSTLKVNAIQGTDGVERYTARAWVNFNGTGTVAIRAAGNVSSITDRGTGSYRVNLTTAMPDTNYAVAVSAGIPLSNLSYASFAGDAPTTSTFDLQTVNTNAMTTLADPSYVSAVVYR